MSAILYLSDSIVVCDKSAGEPSQPAKREGPSTLTFAEQELHQSLHVVHRIDQRASGLLIFARSAKAAARLSELLTRHEIARRYLAIVRGPVAPPSGAREDLLEHDRRRNKSRVSPTGKLARLHYRTVATGERYTLLEITLATGRHHQIRTQLAAAGWPIRGDVKYGARRTISTPGICLHAYSLSIPEESGYGLTATSPPPDIDLWHTLCPRDYLAAAEVRETENQ